MEQFPGIVIEEDRFGMYVDTNRFLKEISRYLEGEDDLSTFTLSERFSQVYLQFLSLDFTSSMAIRGQIIIPISLVLKIVDENGRPIVYNYEVRVFAYAFIQKKLNVQYTQLRLRNTNAFVWIDVPGLKFVFYAMCGYDNVKTKEERTDFFVGVDGLRGLHLCGRPDWGFLPSHNIEFLSFNAHAFGDIFVTYDMIENFPEKGSVCIWGIVPTYLEEFSKEAVQTSDGRLESTRAVLEREGIDWELVTQNSLLASATSNLLNPDRAVTVDKSFEFLSSVSSCVKEKFL